MLELRNDRKAPNWRLLCDKYTLFCPNFHPDLVANPDIGFDAGVAP